MTETSNTSATYDQIAADYAACWADKADPMVKARQRFATAAGAVAKSLESNGSEYLVADRFTVADVLVGTALAFTSRAGFPEVLVPTLEEYVARLQERPAYQAARERTAAPPATV